ncbi:MAG TPA: IPT/TIG domain-containing protein [Geobacteraceae bacterium]|nr:IPT/TIG domain-containing protein [Geobacteraceae bacterium]
MTLRFTIFLLALYLLFAASFHAGAAALPVPGQTGEAQHPPITILSIIPAQGEPSTSVTLSGSGFTEKTTAFLGNIEVPTRVHDTKQLTFDIPNLSPGLYALFLKREDGTTSRTYNFSLLPAKPEIYAISPDTIYACSADSDRSVLVNGKNFLDRSQVLIDGASVRGSYLSSDSFSFIVPRIAAGLHQVQIKNPGGTVSGAQGLLIDGRPEIDSVVTGQEFVNYYNLEIDGRNFQQDSTVVVSEDRDLEQTGVQQPFVDIKRLRSGLVNATEREKLVFVNCGRLLYQRYPYSATPKNFKIQVINANGEESSVIQVSAP